MGSTSCLARAMCITRTIRERELGQSQRRPSVCLNGPQPRTSIRKHRKTIMLCMKKDKVTNKHRIKVTLFIKKKSLDLCCAFKSKAQKRSPSFNRVILILPSEGARQFPPSSDSYLKPVTSAEQTQGFQELYTGRTIQRLPCLLCNLSTFQANIPAFLQALISTFVSNTFHCLGWHTGIPQCQHRSVPIVH